MVPFLYSIYSLSVYVSPSFEKNKFYLSFFFIDSLILYFFRIYFVYTQYNLKDKCDIMYIF